MSSSEQILTVTPNPAIDQTLEIADFAVGQVNRVLSRRTDAGGKGINVGTILADLDLPVAVTGFLGSGNAAIFEEHFAARKLRDHFLRVPGTTRSGLKIVDTVSRETTDINFPGVQVQADQAAQLLRTVEALSPQSGWAVLSGSLPQGLGADFYAKLIHAVQARGGRVVLDTSGEPLCHAIQARPEILKPNRAELEELLGKRVRTSQEVFEAAAQLLVGNTRLVVVSMGAEGALFVDRDHALLATPPLVPVLSTVGAGDAMVAGIVWSLLQGMDLSHVARWSTAFGAYAVTCCGASIEMPAVQALMEQVKVSTLESNTITDRAIAVQGV